MPKTTPKTARGLGRASSFLRHRLLLGPTWLALAVALVAGVACGTGSISFPGALAPSGGNTPGQTTGGGASPNNATPPTTSAAGLGVGFEYVDGSASASAHAISDTAYWTSALQNLTAQATGSVPAARLVVGAWTGSKVDLLFPQGSGGKITNASFRDSDSFAAMLTALDAANANVILEVQPGTASLTALAQAILEQYVSHTSVVGLSVDLSEYGRSLGKTQLTDATASTLVRTVQNYGSNLQVQVRHSDASYFPSSNVSALTFVLDTAGTQSESALKTRAQSFSQAYSSVKVSFIIAAQSDRSWACKLSGPGQLIGDVAAGGNNVTGIFWSSQTVSQLTPTNTFACPTPPADSNTPAANPNAGTGTNPNTTAPSNPNTANPNTPTTDPNTPASSPNTVTTNPNTAEPTGSPNSTGSSPNDTAGSDGNTRGGGLFGF